MFTKKALTQRVNLRKYNWKTRNKDKFFKIIYEVHHSSDINN